MKKTCLYLLLYGSMILISSSCQKNIGISEQEIQSEFSTNAKKSSQNEILPESNFSRGFGINNSGMLAGSARNADGKVVAFLLKNNNAWLSQEEVMTNGLPEIRFSINDPGDIAGHKVFAGGIMPMVWKNGQAYELQPVAGQQFGEVFDINNSGQMVGESLNGNFVTPTTMRATLFSLDGTATDLGTLGGTKSSAAGINEDGYIVGVADNNAGQPHAFLYFNGIMQDLGTLGGVASVAFDINDKGEIVGFARVANGQAHAFLYKDGVMYDLGTLGGTDSRAYGINNRGDIIGQYTKTDGTVHAFIYRDGQMYPL